MKTGLFSAVFFSLFLATILSGKEATWTGNYTDKKYLNGQAVFQLALKDTGGSASPNSPSINNAITLTQYHVQYVRSDGHNVQGVDVPFAFDGALTTTVAGTSTVGFTLVRVQAKEEAPLKALAFAGGEDTITAIAQVTFYGHDQSGHDVSSIGNIEVTFSDFGG